MTPAQIHRHPEYLAIKATWAAKSAANATRRDGLCVSSQITINAEYEAALAAKKAELRSR